MAWWPVAAVVAAVCDSVLDVGCGFGDSTILWARTVGERHPHRRFEFVGLNISPYHVRTARARVAGLLSTTGACAAIGVRC